MADCEVLNSCLFFNDKMENKPGSAGMFKTKYCHGDNSACARHMVLKALGKQKIPPDLFPNQVEKAMKIITMDS